MRVRIVGRVCVGLGIGLLCVGVREVEGIDARRNVYGIGYKNEPY